MKNISIKIVNEDTSTIIDDYYITMPDEGVDNLRFLLEHLKQIIKSDNT